MARIDTYFNIIQGHQITDEELYRSEGKIPVITGANEVKGYWDKSIVSSEHLPCITYPTKGNKDGKAYVQYAVFDANNTAVLIPKPEWRERINLEWFAFKLKHVLKGIQTSKENVSYLNKELIEPYEIEIPDISIQIKELEPISKLYNMRNNLQRIISQIDAILDKAIVE